MSEQLCNHACGQLPNSSHTCRCTYAKGHPLNTDWPHACLCGVQWVDLEELENQREDLLEQALKDPVGIALVDGIHAKLKQRARLREQVLEEAATALEEARVWGGAYGQTRRRPSGFLNAALWVRELKRRTPST